MVGMTADAQIRFDDENSIHLTLFWGIHPNGNLTKKKEYYIVELKKDLMFGYLIFLPRKRRGLYCFLPF